MKIINLTSFVAISLTLTSPLFAPSPANPQLLSKVNSEAAQEGKARQVVTDAIAFYKKHSPQEAFQAFKDPKSPFCFQEKHGTTGLSIMTIDGMVEVSCKYPKLVGTNNLAWKSPDGHFPMKEVIEFAKKNPKGGVTSSHLTNLNPFTGKPSARKFFVQPVDNFVFFFPFYDNSPLSKPVEPAEDAKKYQGS